MRSYTNHLSKIIFLLSCLVFCLDTDVFGQSAETKTNDKANSVTELVVFLEPRQEKDSIKINDSCLVILKDMLMNIALPLGKTFETMLEAGTKFRVPQGTYQLKNSNDFPVAYQLLPVKNCGENQK